MEPTNYTTRELGILLQSLDKKWDDYHAEIIGRLDKIEIQTMKTNGRVSKLENWRSGIVAVIVFLGFAIPLLLTFAK